MPTSKLRDLGFDYIIALHTCGENGKYGQVPMSGYSYEDGYNDARQLAQWLEQEVNPDLPYLVEVPVLVKDDNEQWELFKNSNYTIKPAVRGIDYWKGWIDGIYTNTGGRQRGFYWNLEFPWQVIRGIVYEEDVSSLSSKIMEWGEEFIWIPYVNDKINLKHTDIRSLSKYFTYVFVQPHYYQTWKEYYSGTLKEATDKHPYLTKDGVAKLVEILNWVREIPNGYIEMEVDAAINLYPDLINKACDYVTAQKKSIVGGIWPYRAYYYGARLKNIDSVRKRCPEW